jgi:hypothetical protein
MRRGNERSECYRGILSPFNEGTDTLLWSSRMDYYSPLQWMTCSYVVICGRVNDYKCNTKSCLFNHVNPTLYVSNVNLYLDP